jgi:hypothetical protein
MSQHDFNIANQGFPATRADLNNALAALASNSSGTSEPSTTYPNQLWYDTSNDLLKFRNEADSAWITLAYMNQTTGEWEIRSGVVQAVDSDGLLFKTDEGTTRATLGDDGNWTFTGAVTSANISDGTDTVATGYVVNGSAKVWVNFDGTGTIASRDSFNTSSLTDNGTGNYTISISNSFSSANYASVASGNNFLSVQFPFQAQNNSASACQIGAYNASTLTDMANTHMTAHGDLA